MATKGSALVFFAILIFLSAGSGLGESAKSGSVAEADRFHKATRIETPYTEICTHTYNNLWMGISNWGLFGSYGRSMRDCETGLAAPSAEFPAGSGIEHLYIAAIWIGAVVGNDTLVSVGADGWQLANEFYPCSEANCGLERRSCRPTDWYYHEDAHADQEYIAVYTDTLVDPRFTPNDWSVKNIGSATLNKVYVGIYVDGDVGNRFIDDRYYGDICGFRHTVPSSAGHGLEDTINLAYIADNDGDPAEGVFDERSARSVAGIRFLKLPDEDMTTSFNWWAPNGSSVFDWGPMLEATRRNFGTGGEGVPEGDCNKYYVLSNGEQDYDQIFSGKDFSVDGWMPPTSTSAMLAAGADVICMISVGPLDLLPDETKSIAIAYVAGERFHQDPTSFDTYMRREGEIQPDSFYNTLSFDDIGLNATMAARVFDNPGVDTDGDDNAGSYWVIVDTIGGEEIIDTFYYSGDGVPDYRAVTPPLAPRLRYESDYGSVTLRWNGMDCESMIDPVTRCADFEGYRVYMGSHPTIPSLALVCSQDKVNFSVRYRSFDEIRFRLMSEPMTLASLQAMFGNEFDPLDYLCGEDEYGFESDGVFYCFTPIGWNQSIKGWVDGATSFDNSCIKKTYADEIENGIVTSKIDSLNPDLWVIERDRLTGEDVMYHKFFEYEYSIDNLYPNETCYFSVTAFDFGDISTGMVPAESNPLDNLIQANPTDFPSTDFDQGPQVTVYPNPYYGEDRYARSGHEDPNHTGIFDEERRIHFIDLPPYCTVKIYTISGELVRELAHPGGDSKSDTELLWNLKSKDDMLVTSGIYLFVVESYWGNQIGKFLIIL